METTIKHRENIPHDNSYIIVQTQSDGKIFSVKRPSDGKVFSVGDWVDWNNGWDGFEKRMRWKITWFFIRDSELVISGTHTNNTKSNPIGTGSPFCLLSQLRHIELEPEENAAKEMLELFWDKSKSTPQDCGLVGARHNAIKCCKKIISLLKEKEVIEHYEKVILEIGKW